MSSLFKYYGAIAISLLLSLIAYGFLDDKHLAIFGIFGFAAFGLFVYAIVGPRCPRCQTPLYGPMAVFPGRGLPGRYCNECEYDLLKMPEQISN